MKYIIFKLRRFCRSLLGLRNLETNIKYESTEKLKEAHGFGEEDTLIELMAQEITQEIEYDKTIK